MNRVSLTARARAAWGECLPDWIAALVTACEATSLRHTAGKLGLSPAMLSLAVNKKRQSLALIKGRVESMLMSAMIPCPVLGLIARTECLQEQTRPFTATNPLRVQLYRACRGGCRHYTKQNNPQSRGVSTC